MTGLRNAVEPLVIALTFTIGALINRRDIGQGKDVEASRSQLNLQSRLLAQFPFLLEIWYWQLTYWVRHITSARSFPNSSGWQVYQGLRAFSARLIADNTAIFSLAVRHAQQLLALESFLGIDIELSLQRYILTHIPSLMPLLSRVYFSHISLGVAFLVYCYTVLPHHTFCAIRRTIALENASALVIITLWRCCPPRLMPKEEYGYRDIVHESSGNTAWTENKFRLVIAAMPSLHFANSVFVGWCLARFSPHRVLRILGPLWPVIMWVTIVATANHWVLDTVVGLGVVMAAWRWNRGMLVLRGVEDVVFGVLGLVRPE
ncbi:hypothetical protein OQA88_2157 [Cercophora sp. LCS_1]